MRTMYIGLLRNGTEINGKGYKRVSLLKTTWTIGSIAGVAEFQNVKQIRFPVARKDWGDVTEFGLFTAAKYGSPLKIVSLDKIKAISKGSVSFIQHGHLGLDIRKDWQ